MTEIPGGEQLDLVPLDVDQQQAQLRRELDRLEALKTEGRGRALDRIRMCSEATTFAGDNLDAAVAAARSLGLTWQQIADAAGIVKSAAWERWAHRG